jgi:hypothetical protein
MKERMTRHKIRPFTTDELNFCNNVFTHVATFMGVEVKDMKKRHRARDVINARCIFFHTMKTKTGFSLAKIGQTLHPIHQDDLIDEFYTRDEYNSGFVCDHATVLNSLRKMDDMISIDKVHRSSIEDKRLLSISRAISGLIPSIHEIHNGARIGSTCVVDKRSGVVTRVFDKSYRILLSDEMEEEHYHFNVNVLS